MTEKIYGTIAVYGAGGYLLRLPLDNKSEAADLIAGVKVLACLPYRLLSGAGAF